jgi:hypothetical protein
MFPAATHHSEANLTITFSFHILCIGPNNLPFPKAVMAKTLKNDAGNLEEDYV